MNLRVVDEVYLDLRMARDWYDAKSAGLGDEFAEFFFRRFVACQVFHCITLLTRLDIGQLDCHGSLR